MPSVLSFEKDIDKQLQKHIKKHIKEVIRYCRDKNMFDDKAIHQIRRRFKKLRALLHIFSYDLKKGFSKNKTSYIKNMRQNVHTSETIKDYKIYTSR